MYPSGSWYGITELTDLTDYFGSVMISVCGSFLHLIFIGAGNFASANLLIRYDIFTACHIFSDLFFGYLTRLVECQLHRNVNIFVHC